ncbi:hypothetical protein OS493_023741 [Desmophyllum pertusum]|uniref:Uncharacterized protein n=1 Tax=Desmophyllum pertusum TaxID=174260 RepID=A0A9W9Z1W6_9CNID|nr:hypothetical protein OS493_023741 [Desmophyllum pertusum]
MVPETESSDNDESTGEVSDVVPETESSDEALSEEESSDQQSKSVDEDAVESCRPSQHAEELNSDEYCEHTLRYLVHNTSSHGVRFLLVFMERKGSLAEFHSSKLCKDVFGKMPFSTIREIYLYRKHLTSFYRLAWHYPYPVKGMIGSCLACDVMENGQCSCPVLQKSFYVFCRQKCSSYFNCKKCVSFDHRPSHGCFDFFHCQICDERYKASTKYQPYPPP